MHKDLPMQVVSTVSERVAGSKPQPRRCLNSSAAGSTISTHSHMVSHKTTSSSKVDRHPR